MAEIVIIAMTSLAAALAAVSLVFMKATLGSMVFSLYFMYMSFTRLSTRQANLAMIIFFGFSVVFVLT